MKNFFTVLVGILTVILILMASSLILAFPLKWLWNWVMVDIFTLPRITYLQAIGLQWISGLLFINFKNNKESKF